MVLPCMGYDHQANIHSAFFSEIYNQKIYLNIIILSQVINDHDLIMLCRTKENKISPCTGIKNVAASVIVEARNPKGIPSWL